MNHLNHHRRLLQPISTNEKTVHHNQPAVNLIQQVQACSWNPFKMHELVTLERVLQEEAAVNVNLRSILRKLVNESVFVEPIGKQQHLKRNDTEKRRDRELKQKAQVLREHTNNLNDELELVQNKLMNLTKYKNESRQTIEQLQRSIMLIETTHDNSHKHFELAFERAHCSFDRSLTTIMTEVPKFTSSLKDSDLIRQLDVPQHKHKKLLWKLVRKGIDDYQLDQKMAIQLSYHIKRALTNNSQDYERAIANLHKDLGTINEAFNTEIPEEFNWLRLWKQHIDYLEVPINKPLEKVTVIFHDSVPIDRVQLISSRPKDTGDSKFCELFETLSNRLKDQ